MISTSSQSADSPSNAIDWRHRARVVLRSNPVFELYDRVRTRKAVRQWQLGERTGPAPARLKQGLLTDTAKRHGLRHLVETGTFLGGMIRAQLPYFDRIDSIELDADLAHMARWRFRNRPSVAIHAGDSATVLPRLLAHLGEPALFWLDAHYSGGVTARATAETPVLAEIRLVLMHAFGARHVVLVDDARCFDGSHDYPTLEDVRKLVSQVRSEHIILVEDDVIRIHAPLEA